MIVDFVGQSRQDSDNIAASPSRLINLYRERVGDRFVLKGVPGQTLFVGLSDVLGRAVTEVGGLLYAASGGALYSVSMSGAATSLGVIKDDVDTFMDGYDRNVVLTAGGTYYVYDGSALTAPTGGAFTNVQGVVHVGGYVVMTERNGSRFQWSALQDPTTLNGLNFATAESVDDQVLRPMQFGGNLYLFGKASTEIWYLTGGSGANAFARLAGGVINRGLLGANLIASFGDGLFFIGDDGICYLLAGSRPQPVSGRGVETAIAAETPTHCFFYEDEGHKFLVVRFGDRPSWVYDISTGEWHERATGNTLDPWGVVGAAKAYGKWLAIDENSRITTLTGDSDLGETLLKRAVSSSFEGDEARFRVARLVMRMKSGFQNQNMSLIARFSRDRGVTWSPQKSRPLGALGSYAGRAVWRGVGQYRSFTMELTLGDNVDAPIYSDAVLDVV